jgi:hypothetical protein
VIVEPDSLDASDVDLVWARRWLESLLLVREGFQLGCALQVIVHLTEAIASVYRVSSLRDGSLGTSDR